PLVFVSKTVAPFTFTLSSFPFDDGHERLAFESVTSDDPWFVRTSDNWRSLTFVPLAVTPVPPPEFPVVAWTVSASLAETVAPLDAIVAVTVATLVTVQSHGWGVVTSTVFAGELCTYGISTVPKPLDPNAEPRTTTV